MKLPRIIPPSDLLTQIEGIESGLRQRQRLGTVGWISSILFSALQIGVLIANSEWLEALANAQWSQLVRLWPLYVPLFFLTLSVLLFLTTRYWLQESQASFRYTYSIADFIPVAKSPVENNLS